MKPVKCYPKLHEDLTCKDTPDLCYDKVCEVFGKKNVWKFGTAHLINVCRGNRKETWPPIFQVAMVPYPQQIRYIYDELESDARELAGILKRSLPDYIFYEGDQLEQEIRIPPEFEVYRSSEGWLFPTREYLEYKTFYD